MRIMQWIIVELLEQCRMNKNLWFLTLAQGLYLTNNVTFIAINGLVGFALAPEPWLATLPVMAYVVGSALATTIVAKVQQQLGRKRSFQIALLVALFSSLLCAFATLQKQFWLLNLGTIIAGFYNANAQLYRFAAAELADKTAKEKAISWVLAGGILGAVLGPNMASWTRDWLTAPFAGAYFTLAVVALIGLWVITQIHFPEKHANANQEPGRPLAEIMRQPLFIVCTMTAALAYGVMN
jgi:predicted MFS family arabinose efflux permease